MRKEPPLEALLTNRPWKQCVHRAGTSGQNRPQLLAVHALSHPCVGVADEVRDVLDPPARCWTGARRNCAEARAESTPRHPAQPPPRPGGTLAARWPHQAGSQAGAEHQVEASPPLPRRYPVCSCATRRALSISTQSAGNSSVRRDFLVLVSPVALTERHSDIVDGSASRSTWDQVNARSSSVLAPVSRETIRTAASPCDRRRRRQ